MIGVRPAKEGFLLIRDFSNLIIENEDKEVELDVVNSITNIRRVVKLVPNRKWEGADSLLGLKLRGEKVSVARNSILRICQGTLS